MAMRRDMVRHIPLPEWTAPGGDSGGGGGAGTVSGNPAYPNSEIWSTPIWSATGLSGSPSQSAGGQTQTYGGVTAKTLFQQLGMVSQDTMKEYQRKLVQAHLLSDTSLSKRYADDATMGAFAELFMIAIRKNQGVPPGKRMTWYQILDDMAKAGSQDAKKAAALKEAALHQPTTTTSSQTYLTGEDDADSYLTSAMAELLGRAPTKEEVQAFTARLNAKEQNNPTTTTTHNDGYGNTTSTTDGSNVSAGAVAENYATKGPRAKEAGAYKIQQFTDALMSLGAGSM